MSGVTVREGASKVTGSDRVEFESQFNGRSPSLDERKSPTIQANHVCVRTKAARAFHPSISIPLSLTALQTNPMDHSIPQEPVIGFRVSSDWVRPITQIPSVEFSRYLTRDLKVKSRDLFSNGPKVSTQIWIRFHRSSISHLVELVSVELGAPSSSLSAER